MWSGSSFSPCNVQILDQDHLYHVKAEITRKCAYQCLQTVVCQEGSPQLQQPQEAPSSWPVFPFTYIKRKKTNQEWVNNYLWTRSHIFRMLLLHINIKGWRSSVSEAIAGNTNCEMCGYLNTSPRAKPHERSCHSVSFGKERVKGCTEHAREVVPDMLEC